MIKVLGSGPADASVMIVGEAPGFDEELAGTPFVGASGQLLTKLLGEAGIRRSDCYVTNVCKYRPPGNDITKWVTDKKREGMRNEWESKDGRWFNEAVAEGIAELAGEIEQRKPKIIVGLGNVALWALTGEWGVMDWRGSEMHYAGGQANGKIPFVPTLHPASILRNWPVRAQIAHDLKYRVARRLRDGFVHPVWDHNIAPTFNEALEFIDKLRGDVAGDVETSRGRIVCLGLATSARRAMCIPFLHEGYAPYWSAHEEAFILEALEWKLAKSGHVTLIGQNWNYDASYFDANCNFVPEVRHDTLIAQSVLFPGTPRGLGYLSSMYCDWHCYWKDDARDWGNLNNFEGLFKYNCRDVCATWETAMVQRKLLAVAGLAGQFEDRMDYCHHVFAMQQRGVIRSEDKTAALDAQIEEELHARKIIICDAAGHEVNPVSPTQVSKWIYEDASCRKPARRGKEAGGTGDEELLQVQKWHPELAAPLSAVLEYRSLSSVRTNFLRAKLDPDGMLRSSFMTTGTETFRLTSSKNNFSRGTNLLNISKTRKGMPDYRGVIVPPSGHTYFDCDLARADVWIVAAESQDEYLMQKLESDDVHRENAKDVYGTSNPTPEQREFAKTFVHLTNYGGSARTAAIATGTTVHESDMAQRRWFGAHPGIPAWHKRYAELLAASRMVFNAFGYRMTFFDRVEGLLPKALAWTPQSTVAIVASKIHMAFDKIAGVSVTLQMYDSVAGYYPTAQEDRILARMAEVKDIVVPYPKPLIIPLGLSTSETSWGACKQGGREWPTR